MPGRPSAPSGRDRQDRDREEGVSMPETEANGVRLYYEIHGGGEPLVLVHGSWVDATRWHFVVPGLAESFRVLVYDRRGHSRSERPDAPGSVDEDGDDLAALLETLDLAPAHVVTSSYGGNIALRLATRRPELFRSLSCHEPPLWSLLEGDPERQETAGAQPRCGRPADRRRRSRGRRAAIRGGGRLRSWCVGERATAGDAGRSSSATPRPSSTSCRTRSSSASTRTRFRASSCRCGSHKDPRARPCSLP